MDSLLIEKIKVKIKQIREKMSTFDAYFTKGLELYENKKYKLSIELFKIALSQSNSQDFANYNLALAYQQINNDDEALIYYEKFLKFYPKDQSALYNTALIYFNKEDYKNAAKYFLTCFEKEQNKKNVVALTKCYTKLEEIEKLQDLADYALNSKCKDECVFDIAKTIEEEYEISNPEYLEIALNIYSKLYEEDKNNFDVTLSLSKVFSKKGDWKSAIKYCIKALDINPKSYEANNQLGLTYYCSEDMDSCIYYYEKAFKLNSKTDYRIYSNLAYAYEQVGKTDAAINLFKDLIVKFPNCPIKDNIKEHTKMLIQQQKEIV